MFKKIKDFLNRCDYSGCFRYGTHELESISLCLCDKHYDEFIKTTNELF